MQQAIDRLELQVVREAVAARTQTPLGAAQARALAPLPTRDEARLRIERCRQLREVMEREGPPPLGGASDVSAAIVQAKKGIVLEAAQLRAAADTMHASARARRYLLAREDEAPLLYGLGASLEDLSRPGQAISQCFEASGRLADDASPALGPLRRRLRSLQGSMEERLHELMASPRIKRVLMEPYFTVRGDRYVLPVKASFKGEVAGIVHDASGTGQTVFIEPQEVLDAGNRLKIAQSEVLEEENRILAELTLIVVEEAEGLAHSMQVLGDLDLLLGATRLATDLDAHPIRPEDGEGPGFDLVRARHPLLVLQRLEDPEARLVPNDIGLEPEQRILVLTGPNTGGKTVAMKTVGLLALMLRCGLHLPCDPRSRLGWFERIEVAIGDEQSIASKLSTFAAHVRSISRVLERADADTLVLIDEIASDTDPSQGQALAQAILEAFADRGAHALITTHFEGLKALPFADPRFRNAGVGFDPERFVPTYRLSLDVPQSSNAFDIARGLGLPDAIVERARGLTGEGARALEDFMKALEARAEAMRHAQEEAEARARAAERARAEAEQARAALEQAKKEVLEGERRALIAELARSRDEVRGIVAELQRAAQSDAVRAAMQRATQAVEAVDRVQQRELDAAKAAEPPPPPELDEPVGRLEPGDWVHVPKLGKDGIVAALDGKDALVAVGNMRTRVAIDQLRGARSKKPKRGPDAARAKSREVTEVQQAQAAAPVVITSTEEIDVRGLSGDEAIARLDGFLDHHYGSPATHVRIIHGHGTGALRAAIRAHLKRSGYVRSYRGGEEKEGGDGATVVELA